MTETRESPSRMGRRNPVDASPYHTDPRDKRREECERLRRLVFLSFESRDRDAVGRLEAYMKALASVSTDKPRWQKIVAHANSLAGELRIPRERFYQTALIEFIEKLENKRITEELNQAYKNIDQEEDVAFLNHLVRHYDPRLADE